MHICAKLVVTVHVILNTTTLSDGDKNDITLKFNTAQIMLLITLLYTTLLCYTILYDTINYTITYSTIMLYYT